jgi:hypothetical protein
MLSFAAGAPVDRAVLLAELRAARLPERMIRAMIEADIEEEFRLREQALLPPKKDLAHWWQWDTTPIPVATRIALLDLRREKSRLRFALLGPDPETADDGSGLPPEKQAQVQMLAGDFAGILDPLRNSNNASRLLLPEESRALAELEARRKTELAALLTPEELADYERRTSPAVAHLRQLRGFEPAEAELPAVLGYFTSLAATRTRNAEVERTLAEPLKAALGVERYVEFRRAQDFEFQNLRDLARRAELPPETAGQVFALRERLERESQRIAGDTALGRAQKLEAYRALVRDTRAGILTRLGPEAGAAFFKQADSWLAAVERGATIEFSTSGWSTRAIPFP